jgi:hypothetical protein
MSTIKVFGNKASKRAALALGLYATDICIMERQAMSGAPTFAYGYNEGGRRFPEAWDADMPYGAVIESLDAIRRGARVLREYPGQIIGWRDALDMGTKIAPQQDPLAVSMSESPERQQRARMKLVWNDEYKVYEEDERYLGEETLERLRAIQFNDEEDDVYAD